MITTTMKQFTHKDLKKLRINFDLSITDLAELLNFSSTYLGLIERDQRPMSVHVANSMKNLEFIYDNGIFKEYLEFRKNEL